MSNYSPVVRILFCLALCLVLFFCWACEKCIEYQDIAIAEKAYGLESYIDSVAMIAKDSAIGCGSSISKVLGSKTHRVRFPINVRVQLFSQGNLWKEFSLNMDKNTKVTVFTGHSCSQPSESYSSTFSSLLESAKEQNRFIDLSFTDDYCWLLERINADSHDTERCTEWSTDGEQEICDVWKYYN